MLLPVGYLRFDRSEEDLWLKVQAPPGHEQQITGYVRVKVRMSF